MVSVFLASDALSQHLPSYLGFSSPERGASLHGCSSKAHLLLLTLDEVTSPDLEHGVAPLGPPAPTQPPLLGHGVVPLGCCPGPWAIILYPCYSLLTIPKPLTVQITRNWKILKEMGIPDHLTCLLRNLYAGQKATVRTVGHGTTD